MQRGRHAPHDAIPNKARQPKRKDAAHERRARRLPQDERRAHARRDRRDLAADPLERRQRLRLRLRDRRRGRRGHGRRRRARRRRQDCARVRDDRPPYDFVGEVDGERPRRLREGDGEEEFGDVVGVERGGLGWEAGGEIGVACGGGGGGGVSCEL